MSEAILYAIDAQQVKGADAAVDFVEQWQDSKEPPTERIAAFFAQLLQTWPTDGSKGCIWYEGFACAPSTGPILEMTFELNEFDSERLQQLREIAKHHGVHIFDPEGHALYLSDGSEAGAPAIAAPGADALTQCQSGIRFGGVYETATETGWMYLYFTPDGQILWQSIGARTPARVMMERFTGDTFSVKGNYKPDENGFNARLRADFGTFIMSGVLNDDGMHVRSKRTNSSKPPYDTVYRFLPL